MVADNDPSGSHMLSRCVGGCQDKFLSSGGLGVRYEMRGISSFELRGKVDLFFFLIHTPIEAEWPMREFKMR